MNRETCEDYNYWFKDGKWFVKKWGGGPWEDLEKLVSKLKKNSERTK